MDEDDGIRVIRHANFLCSRVIAIDGSEGFDQAAIDGEI